MDILRTLTCPEEETRTNERSPKKDEEDEEDERLERRDR